MKMNRLVSQFTKNITPHVEAELRLAQLASSNNQSSKAFFHLENAHVLGQESTYWHVKVHFLMFLWAIKNTKLSECLGQAFRLVGASTKTALGLVPKGNTGGSNISPFKTLPLRPEHARAIQAAKGI